MKTYVSAITFEGIDKVVGLINERKQKGIFVNDRGYDSNLIFNHYFEKKQYFIIRLKENRKVYLNHKWYKITTIRDSRKGNGKVRNKKMAKYQKSKAIRRSTFSALI